MKNHLYLINLDKTLADNSTREAAARVLDGTLDWSIFVAPTRILGDTPLVDPARLHTLLAPPPDGGLTPLLYYLTGREGTEPIRQATYQWLLTHGYPSRPCFSRAEGDCRPDHECKEQLLREKILPLIYQDGMADWWEVIAIDDCGVAYGNPTPLREMYARLGITLRSPQEEWGEDWKGENLE